jgi:hypothetical protein
MAAKNITAADVERFEARLSRLVEEIAETVCEDTLDSAVYYVRFTLRNGIKNGYSAIAGEAWQLRIRRAKAEVARRLVRVERPPGALNVHGLDIAYFRPRMQRFLQVLNLYTPEEFARECARMARMADPVVLAEDEFQ